MSSEEISELDYFVSAVPAGVVFRMDYSNLIKLIESIDDKGIIGFTLYEVSLIGLVSYAEAFFKNHYASLINIHNPLVLNLRENKRDVNIDVLDLISFRDSIKFQLGCIVSEQFDFGTAANINSLYRDLLKITPFSKDEQEKYNKLQRDRNLLVHHGGIYTNKYIRQQSKYQVQTGRTYMDSLVINKEVYLEWAEFLLSIVRKVCEVSQKALTDIVERDKVELTTSQKIAIEALAWDL